MFQHRLGVPGLTLAIFLARSMAAMAAEDPPRLVLSELGAANRSVILDEDGRSSDWIELWNRGTTPLDLEGFGLSDDPLKPAKWRLPAVILAADERYVVWASGKNRSTIPVKTLEKGRFDFRFDRTLIRAGESWRYFLGTPGETGPPERWNQLDFDESSLAEGPSGFGYDDNDDATLVPEGTRTVFLRKRFGLETPRLPGQLLLKVDYDDGFVAYLNGVQIATANAPVGIDFNATAIVKHDAGRAEYFDVTAFSGRLRQGENILAIVALNTNPSQDLSIIPELGTLPLACHLSFELDAQGGEVLLSAPDSRVIDRVTYPAQGEDRSWGRTAAEPEKWAHFVTPSPRQANVFTPFTELPEVTLSLTPPPGWQPKRLELVLKAQSRLENLSLRYTLDGTLPTLSSRPYEDAVLLTRSTVIRAAAFHASERISEVLTGSYFLGTPPGTPVLSLALSPRDFAQVHLTQTAHGFLSERVAHLEIFNTPGERLTSTDVGFRLHGGYGRQGGMLTKKSYKLYFRSQYGDTELGHALIPGVELKELNKLVLRANFNDRLGAYHPASTHIRDEVLRRLHHDLGAVAAVGTWCLLHVNMTPRGLYNVVERLDKEFLRRHLGGKRWTLIKTGNTVVCGSREPWDELTRLAARADASRPETFERLGKLVDLEAFTRYVILNLWSQNEDWPQNNWYAAREERDDARWIFLSWDVEWGLGHTPSGFHAPSFTTFLAKKGHAIRDLFVALIRNDGYRQLFLERVDAVLAGPLGKENVLRRIDEVASQVAPFMPLELRTNASNFTLADWERNVEVLRVFAARRGKIFRRLAEQAMAEARLASPAGESAHGE